MTKSDMKDLLEKIYLGDMPTTVIDCDKPQRSPDHPTMKPVPLIGKLVNNSSRQGDIVLDVFGGSGTTLIACEQLHRKCRMVEFEPIYCDVIVKRWEKLTGQKASLVGNFVVKQKQGGEQ
jgi:site-specific DNA-methyltransferase (adenine-specific)